MAKLRPQKKIDVRIILQLPKEHQQELNLEVNKRGAMMALLQGVLFLNLQDLQDYIEDNYPTLAERLKKAFNVNEQWFSRWHKQVVNFLENGEHGWKVYQQYFTTAKGDLQPTFFAIEQKYMQLFSHEKWEYSALMAKIAPVYLLASITRHRNENNLIWAEDFYWKNILPKPTCKADEKLWREKTKIMAHHSATRLVANGVWSRCDAILEAAIKYNRRSEKDCEQVLMEAVECGMADVIINKINAMTEGDLFQRCVKILKGDEVGVSA